MSKVLKLFSTANETEACGLVPCLFPIERACCEPYVLGALNGGLVCKVSTQSA